MRDVHFELVLETAELLRLDVSARAQALLSTSLDRWNDVCPQRRGGLGPVAAHEVGHFVTHQSVGRVAIFASIGASPGHAGGWAGISISVAPPPFDAATPETYIRHPSDAVVQGVTTFAGPLAEHRHGVGHVYNSPGEMLSTVLIARKHSQLAGCNLQTSICFLLDLTDHIYGLNKQVIDEMTEKLASRHRIHAREPDIAALLNQVRRSSLRLDKRQAERAGELARLFAEAPIDMVALMRSIVS